MYKGSSGSLKVRPGGPLEVRLSFVPRDEARSSASRDPQRPRGFLESMCGDGTEAPTALAPSELLQGDVVLWLSKQPVMDARSKHTFITQPKKVRDDVIAGLSTRTQWNKLREASNPAAMLVARTNRAKERHPTKTRDDYRSSRDGAQWFCLRRRCQANNFPWLDTCRKCGCRWDVTRDQVSLRDPNECPLETTWPFTPVPRDAAEQTGEASGHSEAGFQY